MVDDEPAIRSLLNRTLEMLGYTVLLAEHGGQALELARRTPDELSLVLLDLAMPVMDGPTTALELQQRWPHLPIIVMSGLADQDALRGLESLRIAGFVPKPFAPDQVAHAVALARRMNPASVRAMSWFRPSGPGRFNCSGRNASAYSDWLLWHDMHWLRLWNGHTLVRSPWRTSFSAPSAGTRSASDWSSRQANV